MLKILGESSVTFLINLDTNLPYSSRSSELNPQTGTLVDSETVYSDWKSIDGVMYAFTTVTYTDGEQVASTKTDSLSVN